MQHSIIGKILSIIDGSLEIAGAEQCAGWLTSVVTMTSSVPLTFVTGFAKRGLPHTSNLMNLEDHSFAIKRHMKLKLSPVIKLCLSPNFKPIALTNVKLWIVKIGKIDVYGRPFLQIWSHFSYTKIKIIEGSLKTFHTSRLVLWPSLKVWIGIQKIWMNARGYTVTL